MAFRSGRRWEEELVKFFRGDHFLKSRPFRAPVAPGAVMMFSFLLKIQSEPPGFTTRPCVIPVNSWDGADALSRASTRTAAPSGPTAGCRLTHLAGLIKSDP